MARRRRRTLVDRYRGQAQLEAKLRAAPQARTLQDALDESGLTRDSAISAAHGTARGLRASIRAARPGFEQVYSTAGQQLANNHAAVMPTTAGGSAIATAAATEHQAAIDRNTAAQASTMTDLGQQGIRATAGEGYAVRQAQTQYQGDVGKILKQLLGVSQDEGDYAAASLERLVDAARGRQVTVGNSKRSAAQSERDSIRSSGVDPDTGKPIPGGKLDPKAKGNGGKGWATQEQHAKAGDAIQEATRWAKQLKAAGLDRADVAAVLSSGKKAQPVYEEVPDGRGGSKRQPVLKNDGTPKTTPDVPKIASQLMLSTALDQVFDGYVSRGNSRRLHSRRLRIRDLPVSSYQAYLKRNPPGRITRPPHAPGANGQSRPT